MSRTMVVAGVLILAAFLVGPPPAAPSEDARAIELLRYDCGSRIGRRDLTLFANGTLRLREVDEEGARRMRLAELGRLDLAAFVARLGEEDLSEVDVRGRETSGDWVETCELELRLAGRPARLLRFGRLDSLPLALGRLLRVVDDLLAEVERLAPRSRLPADYEAKAGDRLRRFDGRVFEVVAYTGDGAGLELESVEDPLVVFIPVAALRDEFEELVERRP